MVSWFAELRAFEYCRLISTDNQSVGIDRRNGTRFGGRQAQRGGVGALVCQGSLIYFRAEYFKRELQSAEQLMAINGTGPQTSC